MRNLSMAATVVAIICLPGCGRSDLHPVRGRVSFVDGSPVPTGRVVVSYGDSKASWGSIKPDGTFEFGTLKQGDGMRAGTFRVAVKDAFILELKNGDAVAEPLVHQRFADPATSGLEFTVPDKTDWRIVVEKP